MGASGCTKSKVVKRKFEDQEGTEPTADAAADPEADATADAAATAATTATPPDGGRGALHSHQAGRSLNWPPALGARAGAARWGRGQVVVERLLGPNADAD